MNQSYWALAAAAVAALDSPILPRALVELLRQVAPFSFTVMFGYRGTDQPIDLYNDFPPGKRKIFVSDYQAGPYMLDPFFLAASRSVPPASTDCVIWRPIIFTKVSIFVVITCRPDWLKKLHTS